MVVRAENLKVLYKLNKIKLALSKILLKFSIVSAENFQIINILELE